MEDGVLEVSTVEASVEGNQATVSIPNQGESAPPTPMPEFSGAPGDLQKDLALLAKQQNPQPPVVEEAPVVEPQTEPEQSATTPATPVPDKFKNPDGTVNLEKVEKSTLSAKEALDRYRQIEREMRQQQNKVHSLGLPSQPQPAQPSTTQIPVNQPLSPLEQAMAQDMINTAAELGQQMPQAYAIAQARVIARGFEAKHAAELSVTESIRQELDDEKRDRELSDIAKHDQWVLSPEGIATLADIRQRYPHVNAAKNAWTAAYDQALAERVKKERQAGQVQTPNPTAKTANRLPPTPVNAAPRVVVKPSEPNMSNWSTEQINNYVDGLPKKDQAAFWAKRGLKF